MRIEVPSDQPARLVALDTDVQPEEYLLVIESCTIGRSSICQIVVRRSMVSRIHARVERDGLRYILHDGGSANGTFVNNHRLHGPRLLTNQDIIGLGDPTPLLRFVDPDPTFVPSRRLYYDDQTMQFSLDGQLLYLSPAQFRLLLLLHQNLGDVCSREQCVRAMGRHNYDPSVDDDSLDRAISKLRHALRQVAPDADFIQVRRGLGYLLVC